MVVRIQHSLTKAEDSPDNRLHPQLAFPNAADATARTGISQSILDRGRQVYQLDDRSIWMADGVGGWLSISQGVQLAHTNGLRLTPQTGVPVPVGNSAGITDIFLTPYKSTSIALFAGGLWTVRTTAEITLPIAGRTALRPVDIFAYWDGAAVALDVLDWTNATTRATGLTRVDGVLTKTGDSTRRYVGTFLPRSPTTADWITSIDLNGATTPLRMDIWNVDNREEIGFTMIDTGADFNWTFNAIRQWRADTDAQLEVVVGLQESYTELTAYVTGSETGSGVIMSIGVGFDSVAASDAECVATRASSSNLDGLITNLKKQVPIGFHFLAWLQAGNVAAGTTAWFSGIVGTIIGSLGCNGVHRC